MLDRKELLELELAQKGAEVLKERLNNVSNHEERIQILEARFKDLENKYLNHLNNLNAHKE